MNGFQLAGRPIKVNRPTYSTAAPASGVPMPVSTPGVNNTAMMLAAAFGQVQPSSVPVVQNQPPASLPPVTTLPPNTNMPPILQALQTMPPQVSKNKILGKKQLKFQYIYTYFLSSFFDTHIVSLIMHTLRNFTQICVC